MLDAYLRKGAQLPSEQRAESGRRRVIEDAITSTLFTPLRFMSPSDVRRIVAIILGIGELGPAETCHVKLWRKFPAASGLNNSDFVEPDLVIDFHRANITARVVFEVKWDDMLKASQLESQVASCCIDLKTRDTLDHVAIVKYADVDALNFRQSRVLQWSSILRVLRAVGERSDSDSRTVIEWCRDAGLLLSKLGIGTFEGLRVVPIRKVSRQVVAPMLRRFKWGGLKPVPQTTQVWILNVSNLRLIR